MGNRDHPSGRNYRLGSRRIQQNCRFSTARTKGATGRVRNTTASGTPAPREDVTDARLTGRMPHLGRMASCPAMYGRRTLGTVTEPSAFW